MKRDGRDKSFKGSGLLVQICSIEIPEGTSEGVVLHMCRPGTRVQAGFLLLFCLLAGKCESENTEAALGASTIRPAQDGPQAFPKQQHATLPVFTTDPCIQVPFEFTLWILYQNRYVSL